MSRITSADSQQPKLQYCIVLDINAPIERCFIAASAEDDMMSWVPDPISIVYNHSGASEPYGVASYRLVSLKMGMTVAEHVFISDRPHKFGYFIPSFGAVGDRFLKDYQGTMTFDSLGPKQTRLVWRCYFDCPGISRIAEPLTRKVMHSVISKMANNFKKHLESVAAG